MARHRDAPVTLLARARASGLDRATIVLLLVALMLSVLHHTDHVLRVDHSGWPFRSIVTPFTFSLAAYPMLAFALLGLRRQFWWRWAALATGTGFVVFAHSAIERPAMQYAMWAFNRSLDQPLSGLTNLPGVCSPAIGRLAVAIGMGLNVTAVVATVAMLAQGLRLRRA